MDSHYLRHNPANPHWADRDRFVLSNGHGSMLLYALLHLTATTCRWTRSGISANCIRRRPAIPKYGMTPGVETTTGPLGQGLANAVGMALAEKLLAAEFNRAGHTIVDHHTYVFRRRRLPDGRHLARSVFARGHAGPGQADRVLRRQWHFDRRAVQGWFTDDTPKRFEAYGWHVIATSTATTRRRSTRRSEGARRPSDRPTLICCKTVIGKGAPHKAGTGKAHGAPLGAEEVAATRAALGWNYPPFEIPHDDLCRLGRARAGARLEREWNERFAAYAQAHPRKRS